MARLGVAEAVERAAVQPARLASANNIKHRPMRKVIPAIVCLWFYANKLPRGLTSQNNWAHGANFADEPFGRYMTKTGLAKLRTAIGRLARAPQSAGAADLDLTDLLGRKPISLDTPQLQRFIAGKNVLVTGAGGSIGSEICRQCMKFCPRQMILLDQAENNLFEIDREIRQRWVGANISPVIADIADAARIAQVFAEHRPQVIFHCAAHKHVPMMELNPGEAIKNNVLGTRIVADAALATDAAAFVMVSTDKAVNPTSVMGAAKRCAELYIQSLNATGQTRFVAVRFGNVLGSSGSVVPIFRKQILAGGPVTVTHPEMKRFFMTISEASQLVIQAGAIGQGGEIFVLDMGEPLRILDLAIEMIRRCGLEPQKDIAIEFTGIRPGEKLYEELAGASEPTRPTSHPKIRVWQLPTAEADQVDWMIRTLTEAAATGRRRPVILALARCVPEYQPDLDMSDPSETAATRLIAEAA
ncbi:MAG: SDR family NAD(P)-dependent oxidoreductase [Planctomycetota bacterium]|nr:SDR family NAD(P)-dependent oxidoreductase [Planctomycetota bacterium]